MDESTAETVAAIAVDAGLALRARSVSSLGNLQLAADEGFDLLLSFGTSVIVPEAVLRRRESVCLNLHAASPDYPGRDPHHFAAYDGVDGYGATLHFMTPRVDSGPIIDVELFPVLGMPRPVELLEGARKASSILLCRLFAKIAHQGLDALSENPAHVWGRRKTSRADFRALCRIDCSIDEAELERRVRATAMPGYNNLTLEIFGQVFRIQGCDA